MLTMTKKETKQMVAMMKNYLKASRIVEKSYKLSMIHTVNDCLALLRVSAIRALVAIKAVKIRIRAMKTLRTVMARFQRRTATRKTMSWIEVEIHFLSRNLMDG